MNFGVKRSVKKTTRDQFEMLVRELKKHPEMVARPAYFGANKYKADQVWEMISQKLNSIGPPLRTVVEWKKIWADLKSRKKKSNIDLVPMREESDLFACENFNDDDLSERLVENSSMGQTLSPQTISDYEIEEIDFEPSNSIKLELLEDTVEDIDENSNTLEVTSLRGAVFGLGEYQLDNSIATIKTESPSDIDDMSNGRKRSESPQQPKCPTQTYSFSKNLRCSKIKNRTQRRNRIETKNHPTLSAERPISSFHLLRQQLKNQTHLLEALTNSIISLTDKQAAAAERQALATERQAAATERQAAAMEAVLEHFRAQKYADQIRNNASRNNVS